MFENFCVSKKESSKVMGAFRKLGNGVGWGAETFSDWFKTQRACKMDAMGPNQWLSMEKVRLFNVTPLDNTLDYFVKQLVLLGFSLIFMFICVCFTKQQKFALSLTIIKWFSNIVPISNWT